MRKILLFACILLACQGHSQIAINDALFTYTENFDGLANSNVNNTWMDNSTVAGWYASRPTYNAGTGSSNTGAMYSFGSNSSTERALGSIGSNATGTIYYGVRLKNTSGQPLTSISLSFNGEQWRQGSGGSDVVNFAYRVAATVTSLTTGSWTAVTALNYTASATGGEGALDGNANQTPAMATFNLSVPDGQEVMLRWEDPNSAGNDDGVSIDDISISAVTLPIELLSFTAKIEKTAAHLWWATASERNNAYFSIERSADGIRFAEIGQLTGKGDSNQKQQYTFTDKELALGVNFYRLRQVDFDGNFAYSPVVAINFYQTGNMTLSPVPVSANLRVQLDEPIKEALVWQLFDCSGRPIALGQEKAEIQAFDCPVADLPQGLYSLQVVSGQFVMSKRFWKK